MGKQIDLYFEINKSETSACIRWEAIKAFIQGHIIGFCISKARKSRQEMKLLENNIIQKTTDTVEAKEKLLLLRSQYNELPARLKQNVYEYGDKTGWLLAWQIRQQQTERTVTIIESSTGNIVDPVENNEAFRTYYEKLYSSECSLNVDIQMQFLDSLYLRFQLKKRTNQMKI